MKKVKNFLELIRSHVKPRHLFEILDEVASQRIADKIIDDAAFVTRDIEEFWRFAAKAADTNLGECYEFGVFEGTSINFLATELKSEVHGFDSFEGLPSGEGVWEKYHVEETFNRQGKLPSVVEGVTLHQGWISDTLPEFISGNELRQAAFIHIDTDIYESAACIFDNLEPYISSRTVIVFDEFCNYEGFFLQEYLAFNRFLKANGLSYEILAVCSIGTKAGNFAKVAVVIL